MRVIDGLDALRSELELAVIMRLIARTARWVSLDTFRRLPVWYPEHSRRGLFYKENWTKPQPNRNRVTGIEVHKSEGNLFANKALTHALGLRSRQRPNWACCHIWGVDDASFNSTNVVIQDPRFYSCVANMVLLPTPLKAFTDVMPEVKTMLRACSAATYGWVCDHPELSDFQLDAAYADPSYPDSWPKAFGDPPPAGVVGLSSIIARDADKRLNEIRRDLIHAGPFYPRDQVTAVLRYWSIAC